MHKKLFTKPAGTISIQAFRYIIAGMLAYSVDYSLLVIFTEIFKIYYLTAAAAAFTFGSITSYILNVTWVFDKRILGNRYLEFFIFVLIGVVGLVFNQYCIWFFTENAGLHYLLSKFISTITVSIWNFMARKYILFR